MVFQDYALYPHMAVKENLSFGLRMRGTAPAQIESQVQMAAELLELNDLLGRKPSQLSGGQRQRVAIGRAIVRKPKVFLLDEPLSNLDAKLRMQTRAELAELHRRVEATTIYVTHDQVEAMTLADRIVVLNRGRIVQVGTPQEIYNFPAAKFVAGCVGYPSMIEFVGNEENTFVRVGKTTFTVRSSSQTLADRLDVGDIVQMSLSPDHIMWFEPDEEGRRI